MEQLATDKGRSKQRNIKTGVVVSDKRDKTRTVVVAHQTRDRKYGKYIQYKSRYQVHDPQNDSSLGDQVEIVNCRPMSKTKSWRLIRVVRKAPGQATIATGA